VAGPVRILVDADACPVKDQVYRVAFRRGAPVRVVSNVRIRVPDHPLVERVVVSDKFDAADDWIADQADPRTVVITGDILLADRWPEGGRDRHRPQRQAVHHREHRPGHCDAGDHGRLA